MQKAETIGVSDTPPASSDALFPFEPLPPHGGRVAELFAGVGGFRVGLERAGWQVVFGNQWEPSTHVQHAFDCYDRHFGASGSEDVNEDIATVVEAVERKERRMPEYDLLVGGFPCQDYSVAKLLHQARGIQGKKGVLWWQIHRLLAATRPRLVFLENVDRLLKSPASQRGRDFAIMLTSLAQLGYSVEWRVVNAADYGFPQRRRRVLIVARLGVGSDRSHGLEALYQKGVLARALPVVTPNDLTLLEASQEPDLKLDDDDLAHVTETFGRSGSGSPFLNAGVVIGRDVWTRRVVADYDGPRQLLGDVLTDEEWVPAEFFIPEEQLEAWRILKGSKSIERVHKGSGATYRYAEGPLPFPDPLDRPARTVLTGEGGVSPSRFKHVVQTPSGRFRRLTPVELERINGFDEGWTEGMSDGKRAFCMGNALVVGLVERVGRELVSELAEVTIRA